MNVAMLRRDAPLLRFATTQSFTCVCFLPQGVEPGLTTALPNLWHTFSASNEHQDWQDSEFWMRAETRTILSEEKNSQLRVAVFVCDLSVVPLEAIDALRTLNFSRIAFLVDGGWHLFNADSLTGSIGLALWKGRRIAGKARYRTINILQRAALKKYSVDLRDAGASEFTPESGSAFTTSVPFLSEHSDGPGIERSTLMLFEESTLLSPHHSHDAIRNTGNGRYSLWSENLYFSSTDGSDPRSNRRRYRYVLLENMPQSVAKLFGAPLAGAREQSICRPPRTGFSALTRVKSGNLGSEVAERMASGEERCYPNTSEVSSEVAFFITNLGPGGAERQMTYLAQGLAARGEDVRVLTYFQSATETLHYKPVLEARGIPVDFMTEVRKDFDVKIFGTPRGADDVRLIAGLPDELSTEVLSLYTHLVATKPKVVHCWLDQSNLVGAVAAWLAGVPRIVLSSRSVNPTHFPHIIRDWYQEWYQIVSQCPRIRWVANSSAGAKSYAEWVNYPLGKIKVVGNGLDLDAISTPAPESCVAFRKSLGIPLDAPVITAVFRMSHEKRPLRFVRLVWELKKQFPNMHALIAGIGPMEEMVKREICNLKLTETLHLLGKRSDVPLVMRASDIVVLCSSIEGSPNVLIEAGWLGRPVVTTEVGDVAVIVQNGKTGFICDRDDFTSLLERTQELVNNQELREQFGNAAREHIGRRFSIDKMVDGMSTVLGITQAPHEDLLCA